MQLGQKIHLKQEKRDQSFGSMNTNTRKYIETNLHPSATTKDLTNQGNVKGHWGSFSLAKKQKENFQPKENLNEETVGWQVLGGQLHAHFQIWDRNRVVAELWYSTEIHPL